MKRYFITNTVPVSVPGTAQFIASPYHYIDLPDGTGHVVVMEWDWCDPAPEWTEFNHVLETGPAHASAAVMQRLTQLGGILATDSTYLVAKKLTAIHRAFRP